MKDKLKAFNVKNVDEKNDPISLWNFIESEDKSGSFVFKPESINDVEMPEKFLSLNKIKLNMNNSTTTLFMVRDLS